MKMYPTFHACMYMCRFQQLHAPTNTHTHTHRVSISLFLSISLSASTSLSLTTFVASCFPRLLSGRSWSVRPLCFHELFACRIKIIRRAPAWRTGPRGPGRIILRTENCWCEKQKKKKKKKKISHANARPNLSALIVPALQTKNQDVYWMIWPPDRPGAVGRGRDMTWLSGRVHWSKPVGK